MIKMTEGIVTERAIISGIVELAESVVVIVVVVLGLEFGTMMFVKIIYSKA